MEHQILFWMTLIDFIFYSWHKLSCIDNLYPFLQNIYYIITSDSILLIISRTCSRILNRQNFLWVALWIQRGSETDWTEKKMTRSQNLKWLLGKDGLLFPSYSLLLSHGHLFLRRQMDVIHVVDDVHKHTIQLFQRTFVDTESLNKTVSTWYHINRSRKTYS